MQGFLHVLFQPVMLVGLVSMPGACHHDHAGYNATNKLSTRPGKAWRHHISTTSTHVRCGNTASEAAANMSMRYSKSFAHLLVAPSLQSLGSPAKKLLISIRHKLFRVWKPCIEAVSAISRPLRAFRETRVLDPTLKPTQHLAPHDHLLPLPPRNVGTWKERLLCACYPPHAAAPTVPSNH